MCRVSTVFGSQHVPPRLSSEGRMLVCRYRVDLLFRWQIPCYNIPMSYPPLLVHLFPMTD
jgi:hypothetical protein